MNGKGLTAGELAERLGGTLMECPPELKLTEARSLEEAGPESVGFLSNPKYRSQALASRAGLILIGIRVELGHRPALQVDNPHWRFAQAVALLHPEPEPDWSEEDIHPTAVIGDGARVARGATIGARSIIGEGCRIHRGVHIGEDCALGPGCELFSGVVLYRRTRLGSRVRIHANAVLGADGYGYTLVAGRHEKVPQVGWVEVGDDVEIGASTSIDRGALGPTRIGSGTKIDNLCQIAHNVQIGQHCLVIAQTGISGSCTLGDYATLAGKVGVVDHVHIGSRAMIGGNSVVSKDVPDGEFVTGYPARPHRHWMESQAALSRLPRILKRLQSVKG